MTAIALTPKATKDRIATIKFIDARIASRLRVARHESGLSQEIVGEAIGVSFQQIQKYEKGSNRISPGKLAVLAELYGKPVAWFYQGLQNATQALPPDLVEQVLETRGGKRLLEAYLAASPTDQTIAVNVVELVSKSRIR